VSEFLTALVEYSFWRYAFAAGLLASVACGVVGTYVAARRISYIAAGIAHCVLGGMGAARYLQVVHSVTWIHPLHGAIAAALLAAMIIGWVSVRSRQREDTVISAIWAIGMAAGVLFIWGTPGYGENLMSYLFGNILMVSAGELWLILALDVVAVAVGLAFYRQLLAICIDEEFARLRGVNVEFYYMVLLCLTALTVVLLVTVVGLVMVIALLSLPVAIAGRFAHRLWQVMIASGLLSAALIATGLVFSYAYNMPAGAATVLLAGCAYVLSAAVASALARRRARRAP
jgi:zinc transport system permease protein